jgi:hypothetical protein
VYDNFKIATFEREIKRNDQSLDKYYIQPLRNEITPTISQFYMISYTIYRKSLSDLEYRRFDSHNLPTLGIEIKDVTSRYSKFLTFAVGNNI